jgi:hypothetical protein
MAAMRSRSTFTPLYRRFDTTLVGKPLFGDIPHGRLQGRTESDLRADAMLLVMDCRISS